jgi:hypothetical protein
MESYACDQLRAQPWLVGKVDCAENLEDALATTANTRHFGERARDHARPPIGRTKGEVTRVRPVRALDSL